MKKPCCEKAGTYICGQPGRWDFGDNNPCITYCPYCGTKLPVAEIFKFEVVVRYNRGLGAEFRTVVVEALNKTAARSIGEALVANSLAGDSKIAMLGSQVTPIK